METQRVAVFVDLENIPAGFIERVADLGDTYGRVCHLAVYADWRQPANRAAWGTTLDLGGVPKQIMKAGGANSADISIVVDAMELLQLAPDVDVFVLATGDSDFVPLIQKLRARGKLVVGAVPAQKGIRSVYEAAFDRFERVRDPSDEGDSPAPGVAKARAVSTASTAPAPRKTPTALTLNTTRKALTGILSREGAMTCGELGVHLRDAVAGFDHRALGFRRLSDMLRAQSDLIRVVTDGEVLHVALVAPEAGGRASATVQQPGEPAITSTPAASGGASKAAPGVRVERIEWPRLRDHLLAVLLASDAPSRAGDDELRSSMESLSKKSGGGELPAVLVADIVAHYPSCFSRAEDGSVTSLVSLADAYKLRLNRLWEPVARDVMRRGLTLLPSILGDEPLPLTEVTERLAATANGELTHAQARAMVTLVRKADGWAASPPYDPLGRPRFCAKSWLLDPAEAEARIDEAAIARMGPFLPIDPVAMSGALGVDDTPGRIQGSSEPEQMVLPLAPVERVESASAPDDST